LREHAAIGRHGHNAARRRGARPPTNAPRAFAAAIHRVHPGAINANTGIGNRRLLSEPGMSPFGAQPRFFVGSPGCFRKTQPAQDQCPATKYSGSTSEECPRIYTGGLRTSFVRLEPKQTIGKRSHHPPACCSAWHEADRQSSSMPATSSTVSGCRNMAWGLSAAHFAQRQANRREFWHRSVAGFIHVALGN